jgi:hypothetical protein
VETLRYCCHDIVRRANAAETREYFLERVDVLLRILIRAGTTSTNEKPSTVPGRVVDSMPMFAETPIRTTVSIPQLLS